MVRNGNGKSHQGERSEASSARGERERERVEKKTRACPAAVDDDPFSALALRFRFYPGNLSLSLQLFTHTHTLHPFHTTNTIAFLPFLFLLSPRPIISRRLAGSCRDTELDNSYIVPTCTWYGSWDEYRGRGRKEISVGIGAAWRDAEMINKTQAVEQVETQGRWPSSGMRARCG